MSAPIRLVLFDMDDVLCDYDRPARIAHLAATARRTPRAVQATVFDSGYETEADRGTLDSATYLAGLAQRLGCDLSLEDWLAARAAGTRVRPEMLGLVPRLSVPAAILTNNPALVADHIDRIAPGLSALFPGRIFASANLGAAKPDPACFHRCLAALGATPAETLFVDDLPENVEGARQAGLHGHRFTSLAALVETLRHHDVLD